MDVELHSKKPTHWHTATILWIVGLMAAGVAVLSALTVREISATSVQLPTVQQWHTIVLISTAAAALIALTLAAYFTVKSSKRKAQSWRRERASQQTKQQPKRVVRTYEQNPFGAPLAAEPPPQVEPPQVESPRAEPKPLPQTPAAADLLERRRAAARRRTMPTDYQPLPISAAAGTEQYSQQPDAWFPAGGAQRTNYQPLRRDV